MDERDLRIAELEALVAQQRAQIEELQLGQQDGGEMQSLREEVEMLKSIVEAQEEALTDQKGIISSQSGLIDELSGQGSSSRATPLKGVEEAPLSPGSGGSPSRASTGHSGGRADGYAASGPRASGGPTGQRSSRVGGGPPGGARPSGDVARVGGPDRGVRRAGAPPAAAARTTPGGSQGSQNARSQREQLLAQKLLNRVGTSSTQSVEHTRGEARAPRPNSALGRNSTTPRSRSLNADGRSTGGSQTSTRGPSPSRSPDSANGYQPSAGTGVPTRKVGGPLPPALPLLRQEA